MRRESEIKDRPSQLQVGAAFIETSVPFSLLFLSIFVDHSHYVSSFSFYHAFRVHGIVSICHPLFNPSRCAVTFFFSQMLKFDAFLDIYHLKRNIPKTIRRKRSRSDEKTNSFPSATNSSIFIKSN